MIYSKEHQVPHRQIWDETMQAPLNILVIEDSHSQYTMLRDFFSAIWRQDFSIDWAPTHAKGREKLLTDAYDIALIDYQLDFDMSGIDLIREGVKAGIRAPMILLTGRGNRNIDLEAMEAGAVDYLDKTELRSTILERSVRYALERSRTLAQLRDSEARLRRVLGTVPAGIFIAKDGRLVYANETMSNLTQYPLEELRDKPLVELIEPNLRAQVEHWMPTPHNQTMPSQSETIIVTKDGAQLWVALTMSLIYQGSEAQVLGAMTNVTRQKETEQILATSESRFRALVEHGSDIIIVLDAQERCQYISPSIQNVLEYAEHELLGKSLFEIIHPEDVTSVRAHLERLFKHTNLTETIEYRAQHHTGVWRWMESVSTSLIHDPNIHGIVLNTRDITHNKLTAEMEAEQRALAEALLDTSVALNSTLETDEVLERILENVGQVIPYDTVNIMFIEEGIASVARYRGYSDPELERAVRRSRFRVDQNPDLQRMIQTQQPILISDITQHVSEFSNPQLARFCSYVGAPIIGDEGHVTGFINLSSFTAGFFTSTHAERLKIFANHAAIAIRNARAFEQAQELAAYEERQRLARDLHDAVSQTLFSASVIAETLPRLMEFNPEEVQNGLHRLTRMNKGALAEMRTLLMELRPNTLVETDFGTLLQHLVNAARSRQDTANFDLTVRGHKINLPDDVQVALYRIAQEALNNIIKHSRATEVDIMLEGQAEHFSLRIYDNGHGFNVAEIPSDHLGVRIMRERAAAVGIDLKIDSAEKHGTLVQAIWPSVED